MPRCLVPRSSTTELPQTRSGSCSLEFLATQEILLCSRSRALCSCIAETVGLVSLLPWPLERPWVDRHGARNVCNAMHCGGRYITTDQRHEGSSWSGWCLVLQTNIQHSSVIRADGAQSTTLLDGRRWREAGSSENSIRPWCDYSEWGFVDGADLRNLVQGHYLILACRHYLYWSQRIILFGNGICKLCPA